MTPGPTPVRRAAVTLVVALLAGASARAAADICYLRPAGDGTWQAWLTDRSGKAHRRVTSSPVDKVRCSWLGRERRLVVTTAAGTVLLVDARNGRERPVGPAGQRITDAVGLADAKGIAYSMPGAGVDTDDIWVTRFDGTGPLRLTTAPFLEHFPSPCPDGGTIVYAGGRGDDRHDIFRRAIAADPATEPEVLTSGALYNFEPACARGGAVAFSSNRAGRGEYDLWMIPRAGAPPVRLTDEPGLHGHPTWSPDGRFIAYESTREGDRAVYLLDVARKKTVRRLTPAGVAARAPAWSSR